MVEGPDGDPMVGGADPLITNPVLATGETGQIERPGDDRSPWTIGIFVAVFASLISGLATLALTRDDSGTDDGRTSSAAAGVVDSVPDGAPAAAPTEPEAASVGPDEAAARGTASVATEDDERLPGPGFVRVVGLDGVSEDLAIGSACEVHLPLAPSDDDAQVSSYLFRTPDGRPHVVDRRFGGRDGVGALVSGIDSTFERVTDIGDSGAFVAEFATPDGPVTIAVSPELDGGLDCGDTLVTNEQGQLAFPYTRIVMASCTSGSEGIDQFVAGVTSEGGRFTARSNGDDTFTLTFASSVTSESESASESGTAGALDGQLDGEFVDPAASSFENGDRLGYSGIVTNGDVSLDITVDFTPSTDQACQSEDGV